MSSTMRQCAKCGTQNASERDFCTNCGEYLRWDPTGLHAAVPPPQQAPPPPPPGAPPPYPQQPPPQYQPQQPPYPQQPPPQYQPQAPPPQQAAPVAAEPVVITLRAPGVEAMGPPTVQVEPGGSLQLVALIRNQSGIVDNYDLVIEGLPPAWWSISPPTVYLVPYGSGAPGFEQEVTIELKPPRSPEAEARAWPFQLVAKSKAQGGARVGAGPGTMHVNPFVEFQTDLRPQKGAGRRKATFTVTVRNKANAPVDVNLTAADPEDAYRFEFLDEKDRVTPVAGKNASTKFDVIPPKQRWIGAPQDVRFEVHPQAVGEAPSQPVRGTFQHKAWLPRWISMVIPIVALMAVGAFLAWKNQQAAPEVAVPDLRQIAQSEDGVAKALRQAKLELGEVKEEESADFRPGIVIKQDPEAGEKVKEKTKVNITIAVGSTIKKVPNVVGLTFEEANAKIKERGLVIGIVDPPDPASDQPIKSQQPERGAEAKEGSAVDLFFEDAPTESTDAAAASGDGSGASSGDEAGSDSAGADSAGGDANSDGGDGGDGGDTGNGGGSDGGGDAAQAAQAAVGKSAADAKKALTDAGLTPVESIVVSAEPPGTVLASKADGGNVNLTVSGGYPLLAYDKGGDIFVAGGADGKDERPVAKSDDVEEQPAWNKNATLIAYRRGPDIETGRIWLVDPNDPQSARPLTTEGFDDRRPAFSPNGKVIAFVRGSTRLADHDLCFIGVGSGTGDPSCIADPSENVSRPDWSPDGQSIAVISSPTEGAKQVEVTLYTTPKAESAKQSNWVRDSVVTDRMHGNREGDEVKMATWSPDGKWLALTANWGQDFYHLWLVGVEDGLVTGRPQPIRKIQACEIAWRFDTGELVFTQRDNLCEQEGTVKRADFRKPAEQTTIEIAGAANPTWAGALPPADESGDGGGGGGDGATTEPDGTITAAPEAG